MAFSKLFSLRCRFGLYLPGQGPPDFERGDEIWVLDDPWDGKSRGAVVFDVDFIAIGGDTGVVRAMNPAGVVFGASRKTHRVIRKASEPEPAPLCECGHPEKTHYCWSCHNYAHNGRYDIHEDHGPCNYPNCDCHSWEQEQLEATVFED